MATERAPQLSVPWPADRIDVLNAAHHALAECKMQGRGPARMNELVADALEAYLDRLAKRVNDGKPFDPEIGERFRVAATRSRRTPTD